MPKRILIVDDDTDIRDLYEEVLTGAGYTVVTAENGEVGLQKLIEGGFDATLLDIMMPKLDGLGVLTKLRETPPKQPNGPILILTNLDHDPILEQTKALGAYSHILKADILPPALVQLIEDAMRQQPNAPLPPVR